MTLRKVEHVEILGRIDEQLAGGTPGFGDVVSVAGRRYADNGWNDDSLLADLREFTGFPLFRPAAECTDHDVLGASHAIDIHHLPEDVSRLPSAAFLGCAAGKLCLTVPTPTAG